MPNQDKETEERHDNHVLLKDLNKRVRRVETALLGDDEMGSTGFVSRYAETESQVKENTKRLDKIYWAVALVGGATAGVVQGALTIFF